MSINPMLSMYEALEQNGPQNLKSSDRAQLLTVFDFGLKMFKGPKSKIRHN